MHFDNIQECFSGRQVFSLSKILLHMTLQWYHIFHGDILVIFVSGVRFEALTMSNIIENVLSHIDSIKHV